MMKSLAPAFEFGDFRLDAEKRLLHRRDRTPIPLTAKVFDTLLCLVRASGTVVAKETLMKSIWPNTIVEENNLTQNISTLRRILGENPQTHRYIVTVPGRGYRFVAAVQALPGRVDAPPPRSGVQTLAVLPFKPLLPESGDAVLEIGIADTLIARLGQINEVMVRPLSSVRRYGGLEQDPLAAGVALKVESVLDGTVQRSADRIRVCARLLRVADGVTLWTDRFDEEFTDVFGVEDAISGRVARALALHLSPEEEQRVTKRHTENAEAYQLYLTGRFHWSRITAPEIRKSIEFFRRAIELDPGYALAYAGLAEAFRSLPITSDVPPDDAIPQAKAAAARAIEINESLAEPHASLTFIQFWYDWDWVGAERSARLAIALNDNSAFAHIAYGNLLSDLGRREEAIAEGERARALEPVSLVINALNGAILYYARQFDEAAVRLQNTLELEPNFWVARLFLGKVFTEQKRYADALEQFAIAREGSHGNSEAIAMLGYARALAGEVAPARAILREIKALASERYFPHVNIAVVHLGLGEFEEALCLLDEAVPVHDVRLSFLKVDPKWDRLRGHPRYRKLLRRLGFQI